MPLKKGKLMKTISFILFGCKFTVEPFWHKYEVREFAPIEDVSTAHLCRTLPGAFLLARRLAKSRHEGWQERCVYEIRFRATGHRIGAFGAHVESKTVVRYFR